MPRELIRSRGVSWCGSDTLRLNAVVNIGWESSTNVTSVKSFIIRCPLLPEKFPRVLDGDGSNLLIRDSDVLQVRDRLASIEQEAIEVGG